jgi:hypothetical protein
MRANARLFVGVGCHTLLGLVRGISHRGNRGLCFFFDGSIKNDSIIAHRRVCVCNVETLPERTDDARAKDAHSPVDDEHEIIAMAIGDDL